jgi:LysM repeat protein
MPQIITKLSILLLVTALVLVALPTSPVNAQGCNGVTYVVKTGDNLFRIGLAYGLTADQVAAANGMSNVNYVQVAQVLCIPTGGGAVFGTGGPVAQASSSLPATVQANSGEFIIERAVDAQVSSVSAGTADSASGFAATANVTLDATNNLLYVVAPGHIPNAQARVYVSGGLGDISGGVAGYIMANANGVAEGWVQIPFISGDVRQYVMVRSYDGRMSWSFFDLARRFP